MLNSRGVYQPTHTFFSGSNLGVSDIRWLVLGNVGCSRGGGLAVKLNLVIHGRGAASTKSGKHTEEQDAYNLGVGRSIRNLVGWCQVISSAISLHAHSNEASAKKGIIFFLQLGVGVLLLQEVKLERGVVPRDFWGPAFWKS